VLSDQSNYKPFSISDYLIEDDEQILFDQMKKNMNYSAMFETGSAAGNVNMNNNYSMYGKPGGANQNFLAASNIFYNKK
jgi:hypothetical protein